MISYLFSNNKPVDLGGPSFKTTFYELLNEATGIDIAVGYVTADSLVELKRILEVNLKNHRKELNLTIGMHYFDGFTYKQLRASQNLNSFLSNNKLGSVRIANAFRYHGKVYSFYNTKGPFAGIVGSNNLSSLDDISNTYEVAVLIRDPDKSAELYDFIECLRNRATVSVEEFPDDKLRDDENPLLANLSTVTRVPKEDLERYKASLIEPFFEIPLKSDGKSNLNVMFGKGRVDARGFEKPRHWYEVELIVPVEITRHPDYPKARTDTATFTVITDDGWSFACKVSGTNSKNLRSEGDLKTLGKWIKGRLENAGALEIGEKVTEQTFERYGRNTFTMSKTAEPNSWFLNFGRR